VKEFLVNTENVEIEKCPLKKNEQRVCIQTLSSMDFADSMFETNFGRPKHMQIVY